MKRERQQRKGTGAEPSRPPADPHAQTHLRLLDLAEDASLYLRRHADPGVRVAAALLLAASLAACSPGSSAPPAVPPLTQEVRAGLPTSPGTYPVQATSITRDAQGVYGLNWRFPNGSTWNEARSSLMKLAQADDDTLEIPSSGDPILRLKPDTPVTLPDDDNPVGPTPTPGGSSTSRSSTTSTSSRSVAWYPFPTGSTTTTTTAPSSSTSGDTVPSTTPAYRNPPAAEPGQGSVRGSSSSSVAPPSTSARTWTSPSRAASSGQAGGPGRGTAASSRSGASDGGGTASGAARPSSSGFSGGKSGSTGSSGSSSG